MEMECLTEFSHTHMDWRPRKRPRLAWDMPQAPLKVYGRYEIWIISYENDRKNELSKYGDIKSAREIILVDLKKLIEANPLFLDKLQFPYLRGPRLRTLINQGLNWQHHLCGNPMPNPDVKLFLWIIHVDNQMVQMLPHLQTIYWTDSCQKLLFYLTPALSLNPIGNWPPTFPIVFVPVQAAMDIALGTSDQVNQPVNVMPVTFPGHAQSQAFNAPYDLLKTVARTFIQGSSPMSVDFHPVEETLLLVGTNVGDIGLWEVTRGERMVLRSF